MFMDLISAALCAGGGGPSAVIVPKHITKNGVYHASDGEADGYDPVYVNVWYTFPEGTEYEDIEDIIGGEDKLKNEDIGYTVWAELSPDPTDPTRMDFTFNMEDSEGHHTILTGSDNFPADWNAEILSVRVVRVNDTSCRMNATLIYHGRGGATEILSSGTYTQLAHFTDAGSLYSVSNK